MSDLVAFEVQDWPGTVALVTGEGTIENREPVRLSVGVCHRSAEQSGQRSITVMSHRHDGNALDRLRRWLPARLVGDNFRSSDRDGSTTDQTGRLLEAATKDQLEWEDQTIWMSGTPARFEMTILGVDRWVAIGRGEHTDVTIEADGVASAGVRLIPYREPVPPLLPAPMADTPPTQARSVRVNLAHRDSRLVGVVGNVPVDLGLDVPRSAGHATGEFAGEGLDVMLGLGDNYFVHPDVPGSLRGTFGGQPVTLDGTFHLNGDWGIESATITGRYSNWTIDAHVEGFSSQEVAITGTFGPTSFSVLATIAGDLSSGRVSGKVGDETIRLDAFAARSSQGTQVRGEFAGPLAFLATAVGALLYFI